MANVWAIKSGDWSDTTVWNTGALPTSADDVYANNFNVNVNQNITVNSLRNTGITGVTTGGTFTFNTGTIIANINDNLYTILSTISFILVTANTGDVHINMPNAVYSAIISGGGTTIIYSGNCNLTITAIRIINGNANSDTTFLSKTSTGLLTINSEINGGTIGGNSNRGTLYLTSNSSNIINGNLTGGNSNGLGNACVFITAGNLTINGNVYGGAGSSSVGTVRWGSIGILNITGNVVGNTMRAITASSGTINIVGTITGSNLNGLTSVDISGAITFNHIGIAQASAYSSAISCNTPTTSVLNCTGPFLRNGYIVAIASQTLRINFNSNSYFQFKKSNGEDIDYVSTIEGYNYPAPADVRYGVKYKSGLAIGTCHVPSPDNVRKNIPVDNTVGTSDNVNAEDILEAIQNSPLPIAERLRNVATVESTGAQLEAYQ